jgi:hypothetical protein
MVIIWEDLPYGINLLASLISGAISVIISMKIAPIDNKFYASLPMCFVFLLGFLLTLYSNIKIGNFDLLVFSDSALALIGGLAVAFKMKMATKLEDVDISI